jgi:acylphosphatase
MSAETVAHQSAARLRAYVTGRVQGVNFRAATQSRALQLGLSGWVRNRPEGAVEVLAEGPRAKLDELLAFLHRGPSAARVTAVQAEWLAPTREFQGFEVLW